MKAIVVRRTGGPEMLAGETVPDPRPQPREVLVKVAACGVCFHDVVTRNGTLKAGVVLPFIPGHEIAGTVVEVGRDVTAFRVGERVASTQRSHICGHCRYCRTGREPLCSEARFLGDAGLNGGYAEYVAIEEDNLAHVPEEVALDAAAIAACAIGTVFHAVGSVAKVALGETVLVTGAGGGLGIHAVQVARRAGGFVLGQTTSPAKIDAIKGAGAHAVVLSQRGAEFSDQVMELTGGAGADVVVDTVGSPVFRSARRSVARGGRWVLVGQLTGEFVPFNPAQLFLKGISLLSSTSTTREELVQVLALLQRGELKPVIAETLPLEQASSAHGLLESGRALGRVILRN
jgi:D-arabinose 1-dehydrogenase-like Zn-dependent alcohol dehydrogenase